MNPAIADRLASLGIGHFAADKGYTLFTRESCAAIGHEQPAGFSVGSSGVMTEAGVAYLVWRGGRAHLATHGGAETPATPEQIEAVQKFSADLKAALA